MLVSKEIREALDFAYNTMLMHKEYALTPFYRRKIYESFSLSGDSQSQIAFKRLGVITARQVLPIWQNAKAQDKRPDHLLNLAEGVINKAVSPELTRSEVELFWEYLERFGGTEKGLSIKNALYAGTAAAEAVMEVLGRNPFEGVTINESDGDLDLDLWGSDTALWAVAAYAGRIGELKADRTKRRNFWTWWLKEAILKALEGSKY